MIDNVKGLLCAFTVSLPPHKFVEIRRELAPIYAFHSFEFELNSRPVRLHILCVDTSSWVDEVEGVGNGFMCLNIVKPLDSAIGTPFVGMYVFSWAYMLLYDGEEGDCCLVRDNLHVANSWSAAVGTLLTSCKECFPHVL